MSDSCKKVSNVDPVFWLLTLCRQCFFCIADISEILSPSPSWSDYPVATYWLALNCNTLSIFKVKWLPSGHLLISTELPWKPKIFNIIDSSFEMRQELNQQRVTSRTGSFWATQTNHRLNPHLVIGRW